ncbi:MAG: 2-C-methyl-D-erythritol 4-phosphate cytidylyltransferase [Actinomycetaceae bacterium]|nr:2-C-methyl-D-erythritol 4-phosphate cytidylyltransferase [Actinomycetaceae bacterium]
MSVFAVVTAAGSGQRLGADMPKALVPLEGRTLVERAVEGVQLVGVDGIIVTAPESHLTQFETMFASDPTVLVVPGGSVRQLSVYNALQQLPALAKRLGTPLDNTTPILIHDAARCLTPSKVINGVIDALRGGLTAVIPALPVTDTQKIVEEGPTSGIEKVAGQVDRSLLRAVQTPQGFHWHTISNAHRAGFERLQNTGVEATDDAGLVEALGGDVHITSGSPLSMKITTKIDLVVASQLLTRKDLMESLLDS